MIYRRPEDVFIGLLRSCYHNAQHSTLRLVARRRPTLLLKPTSSVRPLSVSSYSGTRSRPLIERGTAYGAPGVVSLARKQSYATTKTDGTSPREIAVLGAGITGLTAAHYLARHAENAHITIYEASSSPGGWIQASHAEVEDSEGRKGHVLLQSGPRMLRSGSMALAYDDLVLFDVLASLNLTDEIRHPRAVSDNRYLYYPDHLVKLPSSELTVDNVVGAAQSFLTEPLWSGGIRAAFNFWTSYNKSLNPSEEGHLERSRQIPEDESVAQFLTRILKDDRIVKNVISGMMHGIYGGDVNKLSAKHTIISNLWHHFKRPLPPGSKLSHIHEKEWLLLADMLNGPNRLKIIELAESAADWKLLAFDDGLISLVRGLVEDLETRSNVTFKYNEPVTSLKHEEGKILVKTPGASEPAKYDHVICTLFSKQLAQITEPPNSLPSLAETHAVTIMTVNLWYPNPNLLAEGGFGYLIPSSTPDNDECALGVLFDSDLRTSDSEMPGTKLTVMLGGHHWDGWEHLPSEEAGIEMARAVVQRQLGISEDEPAVAGARLCRDCLPQHFVGHRTRMRDAHYEITSAFQGHLTVAGPSYTTVGVIPAMRAGYDAAMRVARGHEQPWFHNPEDPPDRKEGPLSEVDYWRANILPLNHPGDEEYAIGTSGLEHFAASEWSNLMAYDRSRMLFRKFSAPQYRFRDEDGRFVHADQRVVKNAPAGFQGYGDKDSGKPEE